MACSHKKHTDDIACRRVSNLRKSTIVTKEILLEHEKALQKYKHLIMKYGSDENDAFDVYHKEESVGTPIVAYIHNSVSGDEQTIPPTIYVPLIVKKGYRALILKFENVEVENERTKSDQKFKEARSYMLQYARNTFAKYLNALPRCISIIVHASAAQILLRMLDTTLLDEPHAHLIDIITIAPDPLMSPTSRGDVLFDIDNTEIETFPQDRMPSQCPKDLSHLSILPVSVCIYAMNPPNVSYTGIKSNHELNQSNHTQQLNCLLRRSGVRTEFHLLNNENDNGFMKARHKHAALYEQFNTQPVLHVLNKIEEKLTCNKCG